jgi:excisionase family DNA binding protein
MSATAPSKYPSIPTQHDSTLARDSAQTLARIRSPEVHLKLETRGHEETIVLPLAAVKLLQRILGEMALGNAVTVMPVRAELTTQQAADLLNVSRPHLIGLLESGEIKHHKVGTHRRVLLKHLLEYKRRSREASEKALQELADLSQELELGY